MKPDLEEEGASAMQILEATCQKSIQYGQQDIEINYSYLLFIF